MTRLGEFIYAVEWLPLAGWGPPVVLVALACFAWRARVADALIARVVRTIACLLLALALSNPTLPRAQEQDAIGPGLSHVRVLLDVSDSMRTPDEPRLIDLAEQWAERAHAARADRRIEFQSFAAAPGRAATMPSLHAPQLDASATDLARALTSALDSMAREPNARDLVLWSDGRDTTGVPIEPLADRARALGIRLHTPDLHALTGSQQGEDAGDPLISPMRIAISVTPDTIARNEPVRARAVVLTRDPHAGAIDLELLALVPSPKSPGASREIPLAGARLRPSGEPSRWARREHVWTVYPPENAFALLVRARMDLANGGEATSEARAPVRVLDRLGEILLVEGDPSWDVTFARRAWQRDPRLRVTQLLLTDPAMGVARVHHERMPTEPAARLTPARLARFDVIVLAPGARAELEREVARASGMSGWAADLLDAAAWSPGAMEFHGAIDDSGGAHEMRLTPLGRAMLGDLPHADGVAIAGRTIDDGASRVLARAFDPSSGEVVPAITLRESSERRVIDLRVHGLWRSWRAAADDPWRRLVRLAAFGDADPPDPEAPVYGPAASDAEEPPRSLELLEPEPRYRTLRALAFATGGLHFDPHADAGETLRVIAARAQPRAMMTAQTPLLDPRLAIALSAFAMLIAWRFREGGGS